MSKKSMTLDWGDKDWGLKYYILKDKKIVVATLPEWIKFLEHGSFEDNRRVAQDIIGDYRISTVFLATDHGFGDSSKPILFETMIFWDGKGDPPKKDELEEYQTRCCTWDEAEEMHEKAVKLVKGGVKI